MSNPFRDTMDPDIHIIWFQEVYQYEEEGGSGMVVGNKRWICVAEHSPTGISASSWSEKSRMKNKQNALEMLRLKLLGVM
jgi:protein subunit release factor A